MSRPFDDPVPPGVHDLDLITFLFYYHDTTYMNVDRAEMDRKIFAALKPGGFLVIADHSALPGRALRSARRCIASKKARCARRSKRPASGVVAEGNFWRDPKTPATSSRSSRPCRSTISCSNSRSRCDGAAALNTAGMAAGSPAGHNKAARWKSAHSRAVGRIVAVR